MKKKKKFKSIKKGLKYWILFLTIILVSGIISYGNLQNFDWHVIFSGVGISDCDTNNTSENGKYEMAIHFLDVGKADCAYIKCGNRNVLIDAADREPTNKVVEYLKRQGVSKLDLIVVSHPHRDHIGQMADVIKSFKVSKFIQPDVPDEIIPISTSYEKMLKALKENNIKVEATKGRKNFNLGDMRFDFYGPVSNDTNINNNSVVLKVTYGEISFLFTGDAEKFEENEILEKGNNLKSTVLKVGHHGSKTSSGEKFLKNVSPQYAVISVGPDRNHLPKQEVLNRINKYCSKIYRTDLDGTIIIFTDGKKIKVKTEK